jgi:hypothetical protein
MTILETPQTKKYVFEEHELKVILDCAIYSRHRHKTAPESGIRNMVTLERIENLIREIKTQNDNKTSGI